MKEYLRFLLSGLVLGLFTEALLKLIAGHNPPAFVAAVFAYPVLVTLSFAVSRSLDRLISSSWRADILHYLAAGIGGLAVEWTILHNGPASNAFQPGMFAMWTTFCFGPRILIRGGPVLEKGRKTFWKAFIVASVLLTAIVLLASGYQAKIVMAVIGLSATYMVWSGWLLWLGWRTRPSRGLADATTV